MNPMTDIVIDIETLGTRPGCCVIEIGACAVRGQAIVANFSRRVVSRYSIESIKTILNGPYPNSQLALADADTLRWWTEPERLPTLETLLRRSRTPAYKALAMFARWICSSTPDPRRMRVWGNGPSFDLAILAEAYELTCQRLPWRYTRERCVRTALEREGLDPRGFPWQESGPRHRALNDARHEARMLIACGALLEQPVINHRKEHP